MPAEMQPILLIVGLAILRLGIPALGILLLGSFANRLQGSTA